LGETDILLGKGLTQSHLKGFVMPVLFV